MRFDCGESGTAWAKRTERWHRWWAWRPVRVSEHDCRWLEWVERKLRSCYDGYDTEYRAPRAK